MTYASPYAQFLGPAFLGSGGEMTDEVVGFGQGGSRSIKLAIKSYGAKAARLAAMASAGLVVPPSVALPISACREALANDGNVSVSFQVDISRGVRGLQRTTRKWLGEKENPLILVVRVSPVQAQGGLGLPVIFIGWTEEAIALLPTEKKKQEAAKQLANTVRELACNVFNVEENLFDEKLEQAEQNGEENGEIDWLALYQHYLDLFRANTGEDFPTSPSDQLMLAVKTVWHSYHKPKAETYRQLYDIDDMGGIGVLIQVYVPWTDAEEVSRGWIAVRCENSGENKIFGEIYPADPHAEPINLAENARKKLAKDIIKQASIWETKSARAEKLYFIIADGKAFIFDGDPLPMSTAADVTFAVEMAKAGAISKKDAVQRIDPARLIDILHARLEPDQNLKKLVSGLSASPGAATGCLVFSASAAEALKSKGWQVILIKAETTPEDIRGMQASSAIVTIRGGLTSHAAVIARGTGKPCIVSISGVQIDPEQKVITIGKKQIREGDYITVDGSTGALYEGRCDLRPSEVSGDLSTLLEWADEFRRMKVLANVETPQDAEVAVRFGSEGIGLCRTEHMMFQPDRLAAMRGIILALSDEARDNAMKQLAPLLREDFVRLFEVMRDQPVTCRLFDPPLHEFLPKADDDIAALAKTLGLKQKDLAFTIEELSETNPMLGNRGCRLLICNPELAKTLVEVVFEAAIEVGRKYKIDIKPEIMVPLVALSKEFIAISRLIDDAAQHVDHKLESNIHYKVGSMIELPRAALVAERIAAEADFFSFGTNDLTQTTFGISRDDAVAFLTTYEQMELMDTDPFVSIDENGVGAIIEMATVKGREANPDLQIGICGEHGGDPASIHFCERIGLDYVSCSPFRLPIARLAAAQATLS